MYCWLDFLNRVLCKSEGFFFLFLQSQKLCSNIGGPWTVIPGKEQKGPIAAEAIQVIVLVFGSNLYSCRKCLSTQLKRVLKNALSELQRSLRTLHKYFLVRYQKPWRESRRPVLPLRVFSGASSALRCWESLESLGMPDSWTCFLAFRVILNCSYVPKGNVDFMPVSDESVSSSLTHTIIYTRVQRWRKITVLEIQWNSRNSMLLWLSWPGCETLGKSLISLSLEM